ncbi:MAG: CoA transferase subunit A [Anaerolineae bacterium]|nr:CoA transferase subunit A [Anaerolineae bacterium]
MPVTKIIPLSTALGWVQDDQTVALGGMTLYRRPVGFVRALLQQKTRPQNLTLLTFTAGLESDMLVGTGVVTCTRTCYFGLEIFGLAPMFTAAASNGQINIIEESEFSLAAGLRAKMGGVGFMPGRAWLGTEMLTIRPDVKTMTDPYTGETVVAFPAIGCDVAVIHVLKADKQGNAILGGNPTIDVELSLVAQTVILTAEEVVDKLPSPIDLPGLTVSGVVHLPQGAWPTSCYPLYPLDGEEILRYIAACHAGELETYIKDG